MGRCCCGSEAGEETELRKLASQQNFSWPPAGAGLAWPSSSFLLFSVFAAAAASSVVFAADDFLPATRRVVVLDRT